MTDDIQCMGDHCGTPLHCANLGQCCLVRNQRIKRLAQLHKETSRATENEVFHMDEGSARFILGKID